MVQMVDPENTKKCPNDMEMVILGHFPYFSVLFFRFSGPDLG